MTNLATASVENPFLSLTKQLHHFVSVCVCVSVCTVDAHSKHQVYETATLAAANIPASFKDMQQQQQHAVVMGTSGGGVKIKHVAHNKPAVASDSAESALPATASW